MNIFRSLILFVAVLSMHACASDNVADSVPPLVPADAMQEANTLMEGGYYDQARELYEKIRVNDVSGEYGILARLRIADTYFDDESYEEAVVEYESFLDIYPYHKYASYAQYRLAMCYFRRIKTVDISYSWAIRSLAEFKKLQRSFPRNPYMNIIDSRIRTCLNILADYEYYVGNFYYKKGAYVAAIGRFDRLLEEFPSSTMVPEAMYYSALSHENLGQREEAARKLNDLIERYPTLELSAEAKKVIQSFQ